MNFVFSKPYYSSNSVPIPESSPMTITSPINVSLAHGPIHNLTVSMDIEHTYTTDLAIFLVDPQGTEVRLVSGKGGDGDNFKMTTFDDEATTKITDSAPPFQGSFRPEESLATFNNKNPTGEWTLRIEDQAAGDGGVLNFWMMLITVETNKWIWDKSLYQTKMKSIKNGMAAMKSWKYLKCHQHNGFSWEASLKCMGIKLPSIPSPVGGNPIVPIVDEFFIIEELLMQMPEDEQAHIGSALMAAQDQLLQVVLSELNEIASASLQEPVQSN